MARTPKTPDDDTPRRKPAAARVPGKAATLRTARPTRPAAAKPAGAKPAAPRAGAKPAARPARAAAEPGVPRAARAAAAAKSDAPAARKPAERSITARSTPSRTADKAPRKAPAGSKPAARAKPAPKATTGKASAKPSRVGSTVRTKREDGPAKPMRASKPAHAATARPSAVARAAARQTDVTLPKAQVEAAARARSAAESRAARTENMEAAKPTKLKKAKGKLPRQKLSPPEIDRLVEAAVASLEDDKAEDIIVLDIATRASFADRMIVATGLVERQITAMAAKVEKALHGLGTKRIRTEASPDWVLLDAGDLVIHLFKPEARANYRLEKMWGPDSPIDGPLGDDEVMPAPVASDFRMDGEPEDGQEDLSGEFEDDVIDLNDDAIHIEDENIPPGDEGAR